MRVSWRARQSCAERHWRAPCVLAHTCIVGGAYWIGLLIVGYIHFWSCPNLVFSMVSLSIIYTPVLRSKTLYLRKSSFKTHFKTYERLGRPMVHKVVYRYMLAQEQAQMNNIPVDLSCALT